MRPTALMMLAGVARALVAPAAKRPRFTRAFAAAGDPREVLEKAVASALGAAFGPEYNDPSKAALRPATKKTFGDFQCNAAMAIAKPLKKNPREVATELVERLEADATVQNTLATPLEVAGPGFVNMRLSDDYLSTTVEAMATEENCGLPEASQKQTIVVDYSSPNIAKEMHVGHLRSTIIGDALANCLELRGHDVIRQNHVGDWGTQFGMLLEHLGDNTDASISDLVAFYKEAKQRFDSDGDFKERARERVVSLQKGDSATLDAWRKLCDVSRVEFDAIYDRLSVQGLEEKGESFYNDRLANVVQELERTGVAETSDGALVVFDEKDKKKEKVPLIIRKSDGGFLYATTDLAAVDYRSKELKANRVLYVTDAGQSGHFKAVFQAAQRSQELGDMSLEHVPFGLVQGEDGKKFATRSGETVRLKDLLDEAESRCLTELQERDSDADDLHELAKVVGIGAVKYADLSLNRESNYKFSYEKMLSLSGNTAPYMLYGYARINGIRRKAQEEVGVGKVVLKEDAERDLARHLALLSATIVDLERELRPNALCDYLFELAQIFNRFYESCPVLKAESDDIRASRATLCAATAAALRLGLEEVLGIGLVDRL